MADRTVSIRLQATVTDYMTKMSAASKATAGLTTKVDTLRRAQMSQAQQAIADAEKARQGMQMLGRTAVVAGGAVVAGFGLAIKSAADFESKMALVRTLSHATAGEMSQLSHAALTVGQAYGFSATQVADAEAELVKAGVSVKDIMGGALAGALTLAAAGQTDVAEATTIAATAMTQFALKGKDVPHIADLLSAGADKALGSVGDLGYALDQAGPTAHQFGVSLEESVGTLAAFAQAGQIGERGGTIFQQMLLKLAAPGKEASQILKNLGITIYDTNGQFVGMAKLAGQLQSKMGGLSQEQRNADLAILFGARAIRGANILYQEGAQGIEDWTKAVNDQGFAALQAAGKLDSLSGDVTKLKTALQTAFIGVGEGSQGPLRTMVQDVTQAVEAWNELPGPVKDGAEAFIALGGAVTLAGGAALLFIPRWAAMNAALAETSVGAITAQRALSGLGKASVFVAGVTAMYVALNQLHKVLDSTGPSAESFTNSLIDLGNSGALNADVQKRLDNIKKFADWSDVPKGVAETQIGGIDKALADLVAGGHLDLARTDFAKISSELRGAGFTTAQITKLFPALSSALATSATSARLAGNGVDQYGNAVNTAGKKTKSAADAAKKYSDTLHALGDPLFAMNQALQGVVDAQDAATHAVHKYGQNSPQARQANLDLASSALDAEAAARTLAAAVESGSVSIGDARKFLKQWVADGLLTKQQADQVVASFDHLIGRAQTISGLHPHMTVTADTSQAEQALSNLLVHIGQVISGFFNLDAAAGSSPVRRGLGDFAPVPTSHGGGGSSGSATAGYTPTASDSGYYTPTPSSGGGGGGGKGSKEHPPTVQEIVHAILTGTIPPSIDQLRKTLQAEIRHLSGVVGSAQQYRSSVRSSLLGYASLSNNNGTTDSFGNPMSVSVNSYLKGRLAGLKQFVHIRNRLIHLGAGEGLIREYEAIGPDGNAEMRQLLSGGAHAVQRATRLEHRIHHLAAVESGAIAGDKYGPQIVSLLQKAPHEEARLIAKALAKQHIDVNLKHVSRHRGNRIRNKSG